MNPGPVEERVRSSCLPQVLQKGLGPISRKAFNICQKQWSQVPDFQSTMAVNALWAKSAMFMWFQRVKQPCWKSLALSTPATRTRARLPLASSIFFSTILRLGSQWRLWGSGLTEGRKGCQIRSQQVDARTLTPRSFCRPIYSLDICSTHLSRFSMCVQKTRRRVGPLPLPLTK